MKLRLELHTAAKILWVSGSVRPDEAHVLRAGVMRLVQIDDTPVFVDLTKVILDSASSEILARTAEAIPSPDKLVWVADAPGLASFNSLIDALEDNQSAAVAELRNVLELEMSVEQAERLAQARTTAWSLFADAQKTGKKPDEFKHKASIEKRLKEGNTGFRLAQTSLINRLLDPAFTEPLTDSVPIEKVSKLIDEAAGLRASTPASSENAHGAYMYQALSLDQKRADLEERSRALAEAPEIPEVEGGLDRVVALLLERDTLEIRIGDLQLAWLNQLELDGSASTRDFAEGFEPMIAERTSVVQKKEEPQ